MLIDGTYRLGPTTGRLLIRTGRAGLGRRAGHDLTIEATQWSGEAVVNVGEPDGSSVSVTVETDSLEVREGSGGLKPLTDADRAEIKRTLADKALLHTAAHPTIAFRSTRITGTPQSFEITGELTIKGRTHPVTAHKRSGPSDELFTARVAVALFGALGIALAVIVQGHSVGFLAQLATTVAASAVTPTLLYTFYWRHFNRTGLLWTVYGGTTLTIGLYLFSTAVSGSPTALIPTADFAWFGKSRPAMVSVPAAFLLGWAGSLAGRRRSGPAQAPEEDPLAVDALLLTGRPLTSRAVTPQGPSAPLRGTHRHP